jgi:hypothetical protein
MDTELAAAIDRFLGSTPGSLRTATLRHAAQVTIEAWRQGRVPTAEALRTLSESLEAMRAQARGGAAPL